MVGRIDAGNRGSSMDGTIGSAFGWTLAVRIISLVTSISREGFSSPLAIDSNVGCFPPMHGPFDAHMHIPEPSEVLPPSPTTPEEVLKEIDEQIKKDKRRNVLEKIVTVLAPFFRVSF